MDFHDGLRELLMDKSAYIRPVRRDERLRIYEPYMDKDGQTHIGFTKLSGKKLYQRLSIPTWHRANLWGLYVHDEMVLVMSMDKWWLTDSAMFHALRGAFDDGRWGRTLLVVDRV